MQKPIEPKAPINFFGKGVHYQMPQTDAATKWFDEQWTKWESEHPDDVTGEQAFAAFVEQQTAWEAELQTPAPVLERERQIDDEKFTHGTGYPPSEFRFQSFSPIEPSPVLGWVNDSSYEPNGQEGKHQVRLSINKNVYNEFYRHCRRRGISMSFLVGQFMNGQNQQFTAKKK